MLSHTTTRKIGWTGSWLDRVVSVCLGQACSPSLRVVTNPRIYEQPASMREAWDQVAAWLSCTPTWVPVPTDRHAELLRPLLALPGVRGNLVHDADLAALAIGHGLTLCSTDGDFARFPGLRWQNP